MEERWIVFLIGVFAVLYGLFNKTFYRKVPGWFGEEKQAYDEDEVGFVRIGTVVAGVILMIAGLFWKQLGKYFPLG